MSKAITNPCTCIVCTFPADQPFDVDAREFLKCKRLYNDFGPSGVMSAKKGSFMFKEKQWWLLFEPHAKPWITAAINAGEIESPTEAWFGASCLISVCNDPEFGKREWLDLTGFELLFENIGHGGLLPDWSIRAVILGMRSFMRYLGQEGVVDSVSATHIDQELRNWEERIVDYLENDGPWCRPEKDSQRHGAN